MPRRDFPSQPRRGDLSPRDLPSGAPFPPSPPHGADLRCSRWITASGFQGGLSHSVLMVGGGAQTPGTAAEWTTASLTSGSQECQWRPQHTALGRYARSLVGQPRGISELCHQPFQSAAGSPHSPTPGARSPVPLLGLAWPLTSEGQTAAGEHGVSHCPGFPRIRCLRPRDSEHGIEYTVDLHLRPLGETLLCPSTLKSLPSTSGFGNESLECTRDLDPGRKDPRAYSALYRQGIPENALE